MKTEMVPCGTKVGQELLGVLHPQLSSPALLSLLLPFWCWFTTSDLRTLIIIHSLAEEKEAESAKPLS